MKYGMIICVSAALLLGLWICGCEKQQKVEAEQEEPLLLDAGEAAYDGPMADNSRCYVCHMNYQTEQLTLTHAKAEIGCEQCHGASDAHCSDEDNITPPDTIFPKDWIVEYCMKCHPKDKVSIPAHKELFAGEKVCTDCHGKHRLPHRTRRWDKKTRKLIEDDNVRMLTDEMLKKD